MGTKNLKLCSKNPLNWSVLDVSYWLFLNKFNDYIKLFEKHKVDGKVLLSLSEEDLKNTPLSIPCIGDIKKLNILVLHLNSFTNANTKRLPLAYRLKLKNYKKSQGTFMNSTKANELNASKELFSNFDQNVNKIALFQENEIHIQNSLSPEIPYVFKKPPNIMQNVPLVKNVPNLSLKHINGTLPSEINRKYARNSTRKRHISSHQFSEYDEDSLVLKLLLAFAYSLFSFFVTSFIMVIVHDRVPDINKYPPLPDIFLDNIPVIPGAFYICEQIGILLAILLMTICVFHRHRFVILRRFFALTGTVFMLRCITMVITSLSVPGSHLKCHQKVSINSDFSDKIMRALKIWSGFGMSLVGIKTCGDYMFSGHTVILTMLNFFITEYTPRSYYLLHTFSWVLNLFGIFFILAAHEHYSIDVFIAFYITTRLFLYYHSLANNRALKQKDSDRVRNWFPMFSYFESKVEGLVPNEYELPCTKATFDHHWKTPSAVAKIVRLCKKRFNYTMHRYKQLFENRFNAIFDEELTLNHECQQFDNSLNISADMSANLDNSPSYIHNSHITPHFKYNGH